MQSTQFTGKHFFIIDGREIGSSEGTAQDNPTAMAIYSIAIIPLILMIVDITYQDDSSTKTAAYADDFTTAGKITQLKKWWDTICQLGPKSGYYPESEKSWLIIKEISSMRQIFFVEQVSRLQQTVSNI